MTLEWDRQAPEVGVGFAYSKLVPFCSGQVSSTGGCSSFMCDSGAYKWSSALISKDNVLARGGYHQLLALQGLGQSLLGCQCITSCSLQVCSCHMAAAFGLG